MWTGRRRVLSGVAALMISAAVLAGCASGPDEASSAAIVGSTGIPLSEIQSQLDAALANPDVTALITQRGAKDSDVSRELVARAVRHVLLEDAARRDGIVISESQVTAYLDSAAGKAAVAADVLADPATERARAKDRLIAVELARRSVDTLAVTVDAVQVGSRAEAEATAREVAKGGAAAEAVFNRPGAQRAQQIPAADAGPLAATALFGTPSGHALAFQPSPGQGTWVVVRITDRELARAPASTSPSGSPSASASAATADEESLQVIGERLVQPLAEDLGVRVNTRYGVWDPVTMTVVAPGNSGGLILPISGG